MKFIDEVTIEVASGRGGPGCVSFRREKFVPRGGPDGGDGGKGGDVVFETSERVHSLLDLKYKSKYKADDGDPGANKNCSGLNGKDLVIIVPPGTQIKDTDGNVIKDLGPNEKYLFLEGGLGGKGNTFYKSSVNQAPGVAQKGMVGHSRTIRLELKLIADIGIIGFPNAGKSTLISRISEAKPKIADYPFTTLVPNLGVVRYDEERNFVVADMPGLIKGASEGVGLGTRFLKHIERTKCFLHLIDGSGLNGRDPFTDYLDINYELSKYDEQHEGEDGFLPLAGRAQIVAINKMDVADPITVKKLLTRLSKEPLVTVIEISAATGKNIKPLVYKMGEMVFDEGKNENKKQESFVYKKTKKIEKKSKTTLAKKAKTGQKENKRQKNKGQKIKARTKK